MPLLVTIREAPRVRTAKAQVCVAICRLPGQIAPFLFAAPSLPPQSPHAPRARNVSPGVVFPDGEIQGISIPTRPDLPHLPTHHPQPEVVALLARDKGNPSPEYGAATNGTAGLGIHPTFLIGAPKLTTPLATAGATYRPGQRLTS